MHCRLCLIECNSSVVHLFHNGEESDVTKLITKYIHLQITQSDDFSSVVCENCFKHLNEFHDFYLLVEQKQTELRNEFLEVKCILTGDSMNPYSRTIKEGTYKDNNTDESLVNIENVMIDNVQNADTSLKEEFEFASGNDDNDNDIGIEDLEESNLNENDEDDMPLYTLLDKTNRSKPLKQFSKSKSKPKPNSVTSKKKRGRPRKSNNAEVVKPERKKYNTLSKESKQQDELIFKSIRLKCEICEASASTFSELKTHFREVHNSKAYVICCGRAFRRRFVLLDHLRYHLNPEHFKCEICKKVLKSKNCLENHHANMHSDALQRKHECQICQRRFAHVTNLNSHMLTHVIARNHICEFCKKGFKSAHLLKNHITYVHENKQPFICEICGQKYKFKPAFQRHLAEHDAAPNQLTEECPICKKWFRPNGLRFHMGRHELEDVKCEMCGKIVKSKLALKSHIKYWHTKREILKCTYCDKTFKRSCVLKEHIAMHTGRKDYNCSHCPREFRSKANMYAHVKKMHFEQWSQAQMLRTRGPNGISEKQE